MLSQTHKNNHRYKLCIGIPIYNEEKYIEECLLSLKKQKVDDVLFFLSDNASTDETFELARRITLDDPRFILHQHKNNTGAYNNFKYCFQATNSEYFMWLGGHDTISRNYLELVMDHLENNPNISMAIGQPYRVDECGDPQKIDGAIYRFTEKKLGRYLQSVRNVSNCTIFHSMFRRDILPDYIFKEIAGLDNIIISHLLWHGNLHYLEDPQYFRRYFKGRTSNQENRVTGVDKMLYKYDYIEHYLNCFSSIYVGNAQFLGYISNEIIHILQKRYGIQSLMPDDQI